MPLVEAILVIPLPLLADRILCVAVWNSSGTLLRHHHCNQMEHRIFSDRIRVASCAYCSHFKHFNWGQFHELLGQHPFPFIDIDVLRECIQKPVACWNNGRS